MFQCSAVMIKPRKGPQAVPKSAFFEGCVSGNMQKGVEKQLKLGKQQSSLAKLGFISVKYFDQATQTYKQQHDFFFSIVQYPLYLFKA